MPNIALIEDDNIFTENLKELIEEEGHSCHTYNKADMVLSNLDIIAGMDTIILDLMMMRGNQLRGQRRDCDTGELLYQKIREKNSSLKIIIVTAKNRDRIEGGILQNPNTVFVKKPLSYTAGEVISEL